MIRNHFLAFYTQNAAASRPIQGTQPREPESAVTSYTIEDRVTLSGDGAAGDVGRRQLKDAQDIIHRLNRVTMELYERVVTAAAHTGEADLKSNIEKEDSGSGRVHGQ
jgi:hypothetical protein